MSELQPTILVIDDNILMRNMLLAGLERAGYRVLLAEDGIKGFEICKQEKPALLIADIMMPHLNGFEMLDKLKLELPEQTPPIIFMTANYDSITRMQAIEKGAVAVLKKPTPVKEILDVIEEALGKSS